MADPSSRRKLAAILSADVVGYSSLMAANEAATIETLKSYRDIIARLVVRRSGRVVNAPGDALLAEFPSAVEAVQAAIEIQKSLEGHNIELEPERRMQFRIGVNLGDVIEEADGTIYGDGVNIAARMEALAEGGGVCISSTVYDAVEGKLACGFDFLGEQQVKNIAKPVRVYRVRAEPKPSARPRSKRRLTWQIVVPALALILMMGAIGAWFYRDRWMPAPEIAAEHPVLGAFNGPSIAVLPFVNLSGDPQQEWYHPIAASALSAFAFCTNATPRSHCPELAIRYPRTARISPSYGASANACCASRSNKSSCLLKKYAVAATMCARASAGSS
jgi:class 3 adenylate cyclase